MKSAMNTSHPAMTVAADHAAFVAAITAYTTHLNDNYNAKGGGWGKSFAVVGNGSKYAAIVSTDYTPGRSAHSFVVLADGGKFKRGDILKAAGWGKPAMNFARGNVFNPASYAGHSWAGL